MPFHSFTTFVKFATFADPNSVVISHMPLTRETVTRHGRGIHQKVLRQKLINQLKNAIFWSTIVDESNDTAKKEQRCMYVHFVNVEKQEVVEDFLEMKQVHGHPNDTAIFEAMMQMLDPEYQNCQVTT